MGNLITVSEALKVFRPNSICSIEIDGLVWEAWWTRSGQFRVFGMTYKRGLWTRVRSMSWREFKAKYGETDLANPAYVYNRYRKY